MTQNTASSVPGRFAKAGRTCALGWASYEISLKVLVGIGRLKAGWALSLAEWKNRRF